MDQSPLAQAEARILELEAEVERLEREKECLAWNHRQAESILVDLRQDRDDAHDTLARMAAYLGHEISSEYTHAHLLDEVARMAAVAEKADLLAQEVSIELACGFEKDSPCRKCKKEDLCAVFMQYEGEKESRRER